MTTAGLKANPKVYWIWNHRRWCLENVPDGPEEECDGWKQGNWDRELLVVEKMLEADSRNCGYIVLYDDQKVDSVIVHAWNYRRYVLGSMPKRRSGKSELGYTMEKIEKNFSNFSAWHQRSKVLIRLWESGEMDSKKSREEGE